MVENKPRKFSIDLLRIFVMYFIVVWHVCNQSGFGNSSSSFSQQAVFYLYKTLTCVSVNVFALISGYVGYGSKKMRLSKIIDLWFVTVFYGIVISIGMICLGIPGVGVKDFVKSFLPITLNTYWYLSAYVGLFFLMPLINKLVKHISAENFFKGWAWKHRLF